MTNNLRKAAEMALEALDYEAEEEPDSIWKAERDALRQALAEPKREWFGLTDEEIDKVSGDVGYGYIDVAKAIEAKLKEKNNGSSNT